MNTRRHWGWTLPLIATLPLSPPISADGQPRGHGGNLRVGHSIGNSQKTSMALPDAPQQRQGEPLCRDPFPEERCLTYEGAQAREKVREIEIYLSGREGEMETISETCVHPALRAEPARGTTPDLAATGRLHREKWSP
jgi:hypothetical protein